MRHLLAAAVAALLLPTLVGCAGDEAPEASPATSASSTSPSAVAAPTLPAAATGTGPKAAEAFVRHYVDLINHALATLDGAPLRAASSSACEACEALLQALQTTKQRNGRYEGGRWKILRLGQRPHAIEGEHNLRATVHIGAERVIHLDPKDTARFPERDQLYNFIVQAGDQGLSVQEILGVVQ